MVLKQSKRSHRIEGNLVRTIAMVLQRHIKDPRVEGVFITAVKVTDDLQHAKVYFSLAGPVSQATGEDDASMTQAHTPMPDPEKIETAQKGLDSAQGFIKKELAKTLDLRYIPDLIFCFDTTNTQGHRIDSLLQQIREDSSSGNEQISS